MLISARKGSAPGEDDAGSCTGFVLCLLEEGRGVFLLEDRWGAGGADEAGSGGADGVCGTADEGSGGAGEEEGACGAKVAGSGGAGGAEGIEDTFSVL